MRKAFISPSKYVQGQNELLNLGYYVKTYGTSALLIASNDDVNRVKAQLEATQAKYNISFVASDFKGECSRTEVARLQAVAKDAGCDCIIGLGGGKAIDTAKCVAQGERLIIVPTIAATDAPTSHSAVLYTEDGAFDDYAYFKASPSVVMIDTDVIAKAPTRFLVAGMGDALATYFEARANLQSFSAINAGLPNGALEDEELQATTTLTAQVLAELCYKTLLRDGYKAKLACDQNSVTPALENIVETNILLSGLGFESGGLAAAHAIHNGLTVLEEAHHCFHGEKVAFGVLVQLVLENAPMEEIKEVIQFCKQVGLPICLADLHVSSISDEQLLEVAEKAVAPGESIYAMPFAVSAIDVVAAIKCADALGSEAKQW